MTATPSLRLVPKAAETSVKILSTDLLGRQQFPCCKTDVGSCQVGSGPQSPHQLFRRHQSPPLRQNGPSDRSDRPCRCRTATAAPKRRTEDGVRKVRPDPEPRRAARRRTIGTIAREILRYHLPVPSPRCHPGSQCLSALPGSAQSLSAAPERTSTTPGAPAAWCRRQSAHHLAVARKRLIEPLPLGPTE